MSEEFKKDFKAGVEKVTKERIIIPEIVRDLKIAFPFGHPRFVSTVVDQMKLHSDKNHDYARGGDPLGNFVRVSTILKLWPNFPYDTPEGVAFIYALKQLDAEAWTMCQGGECKVEGLNGRTDDQAVYANLRRCMRAPTSVAEFVEEHHLEDGPPANPIGVRFGKEGMYLDEQADTRI